MSSSQRSSSGVRNLRALFENQDSTDSLSPSRGRSPSGSVGGSSNTDRSPAPSSLGTRKVRASFVPVEPSGREFNGTGLDPSSLNRRTIASQMSSAAPIDDNGSGQVDGSGTSFQSTAVPTPLVDIAKSSTEQSSEGMIIPTREPRSEHPDKIVSSLEDPEAELQPADVTNANVVAGDAGQLSSPVNVSNGSPGVMKSPTNPKSSGLPAGAHSSKAMPASKPSKIGSAHASPSSAKPHVKDANPVRLSSHLMQPTASFAAKHEPEAAPAKPRPTSLNQKSLPVSSHLMAPTAASKARHEADSPTSPPGQKIAATKPAAASATSKERSSLTGTAASRKPPVPNRSSLARTSNGTASQQPQQTTASKAPPSGDFLSRMMKPTTASSSKYHEKTEVKSPPRPKPAGPATTKTEHIAKPPKSSGPKPSTASPTAPKSRELASKPSSSQQPKVATSPEVNTSAAAVETTELEAPESSRMIDPPAAAPASVIEAEEEMLPSPAPTPSSGAAAPATASTQGVPSSVLEEWNPAALPRTPQSKRDNPLDLAGDEISKGNSKAGVEAGRRSMMETPELEGATIH